MWLRIEIKHKQNTVLTFSDGKLDERRNSVSEKQCFAQFDFPKSK